jgi:hypothetical protein
MEGSKSEHDTSNSSLTNLSNESKQTSNDVRIQKLAMLKLHLQLQRRCPSLFKVNGRLLNHKNKLNPHRNYVIVFLNGFPK